MLDKKTDDKKTHWEHVYQTKSPLEVSWYQTDPSMSLELINKTKLNKEQRIIDVGGGPSILVDCLFNAGFKQLAVLDISSQSLQYAKTRLGEIANQIEWYEADVTAFQPVHPYELWHDRAVFHFLTHAEDRKRYVQVLKNTLVPNGHLIIATFAIDGPSKCSGLDIVQYDAPLLCAEIGEEFELLEVRNETHITPAKMVQKFTYFRLKRQW